MGFPFNSYTVSLCVYSAVQLDRACWKSTPSDFYRHSLVVDPVSTTDISVNRRIEAVEHTLFISLDCRISFLFSNKISEKKVMVSLGWATRTMNTTFSAHRQHLTHASSLTVRASTANYGRAACCWTRQHDSSKKFSFFYVVLFVSFFFKKRKRVYIHRWSTSSFLWNLKRGEMRSVEKIGMGGRNPKSDNTRTRLFMRSSRKFKHITPLIVQ